MSGIDSHGDKKEVAILILRFSSAYLEAKQMDIGLKKSIDDYINSMLIKFFDKVHTRWIGFNKICYSENYSNLDHNDLVTDLWYKKLEDIHIWVVYNNNMFYVYLSYSNENFPDETPHQRHHDRYFIINTVTDIESVADLVLNCFEKFHNPLWNESYVHKYTHVVSWDSILNHGRIAWVDNVENDFNKKTILQRLKQELLEINNSIKQESIFSIDRTIKDDKLLMDVNEQPYIARTRGNIYHILI